MWPVQLLDGFRLGVRRHSHSFVRVQGKSPASETPNGEPLVDARPSITTYTRFGMALVPLTLAAAAASTWL
jgi:hypothetical protein